MKDLPIGRFAVCSRLLIINHIFEGRCAYCNKRGATIGCRVDRCAHSFHLHCARGAGCTFYPASHVIACTTHAPAFQHEAEKDR